jgi:hypothetical protein
MFLMGDVGELGFAGFEQLVVGTVERMRAIRAVLLGGIRMGDWAWATDRQRASRNLDRIGVSN